MYNSITRWVIVETRLNGTYVVSRTFTTMEEAKAFARELQETIKHISQFMPGTFSVHEIKIEL